MIQRRLVRETVLQAVYAFLQSGDSSSQILTNVLHESLKEDKDALRFGERLFLGTIEYLSSLD